MKGLIHTVYRDIYREILKQVYELEHPDLDNIKRLQLYLYF